MYLLFSMRDIRCCLNTLGNFSQCSMIVEIVGSNWVVRVCMQLSRVYHFVASVLSLTPWVCFMEDVLFDGS
jgi:hypothetical protein